MMIQLKNGDILISALNNTNINNNFLLEQIKLLCYNSCLRKINQIRENQKSNYKKIQEILEKSNKYQSNQTPYYYKELGICYFYNGRRITQIKKLINEYKDNIKDEKWRYYDAIVSAYENKPEQEIIDQIFLAFKEKCDLDELISLIEDIPELETKNMLNFILFILNFENKKIKNGKIFLEKYLSTKNTKSFEPQTLHKLSERYKYKF